jgi:glycosyltransferase involved in cell wall biosynthesis
MKVSVVITTYNRATYVRQAIDSVLCQTMEDPEVIVVDDGSTDNTAESLASYRDRIRYVRTENGGPARARNVGMALARGEYICWLDSDDLFHPTKLALQAAVLDEYPDVGMVCTECTAFDDHGLWLDFHLQTYHETAYRRGGVTYDNLFDFKTPIGKVRSVNAELPADSTWNNRYLYTGNIFDRYLTNIVVFTNSMMFRRKVLDVTGMQNPRFAFFEELEFALRICRDNRVAFLDVPVYQIRYHPHQVSTTVGPRASWIMLRKQQDLLRILMEHGVHDRAYYGAHKDAIDRQVSRLCRVVAVLLLAYDRGSEHQHTYYPRRARAYLRRSAQAGQPHRLLWLSSYLPRVLRRVLMKVESLVVGSRNRPAA